jgi:hypothetical protein
MLIHPLRLDILHHRAWAGTTGSTNKLKGMKAGALVDAKNWAVMKYDRARHHHVVIQNKKGQREVS